MVASPNHRQVGGIVRTGGSDFGGHLLMGSAGHTATVARGELDVVVAPAAVTGCVAATLDPRARYMQAESRRVAERPR